MSFFVSSVYDTKIGTININDYFQSYTYTKNLVDLTGHSHYYDEWVEIFFNAPDSATHYYKTTMAVMGTPSQTPTLYASSLNRAIDIDGNTFGYLSCSNSPFIVPPYEGISIATLQSGSVPDGFEGYYNAIHFGALGDVQWFGGGLYIVGGTYSITVTVEEVGSGGGIVSSLNNICMILEQN